MRKLNLEVLIRLLDDSSSRRLLFGTALARAQRAHGTRPTCSFMTGQCIDGQCVPPA